MNGKLSWAIFWALIGVFVVIASAFLVPAIGELLMGLLFITVSGAVFILLGGALIFLTVKEKVGGLLKKFFILTGAAAVGIPISAVLHNAIYALVLVKMLNRPDIDEPFFFIMAIFVCPLGFLVGAVGSVVLFIKRRKR